MNTDKPRIAIAYGFCEGLYLGRKLQQSLEKCGFAVTKDMRQAEIVISHSGGYVHIPTDHRASLIIHIGTPYNTAVSRAQASREKIKMDFHSKADEPNWGPFIWKSFWNSLYFWNIRASYKMYKDKDLHLLKQGTVKTVFIRNVNDPLCSPQFAHLPIVKNNELIILSGQHDDCWLHTEVYADIVQSKYGTVVLAQTDKSTATF